MPKGFCESGKVGTSKTRSRSRARFRRARTWRKQPKKVSLTSSKRYSRVLARFMGTWGTCCAADAIVGTRTGGLWVVLTDLLTSQETASDQVGRVSVISRSLFSCISGTRARASVNATPVGVRASRGPPTNFALTNGVRNHTRLRNVNSKRASSAGTCHSRRSCSLTPSE